LLKEVDFSQTRANARAVLKNFRRLDRIAGRSLVDVRSPIITDMPKGIKHGNKAEDALISRQVLHYSFCDVEKHPNWEIGQLIRGYGEKNVEKLKSNALIEFAEAYKHGTLVVYK